MTQLQIIGICMVACPIISAAVAITRAQEWDIFWAVVWVVVRVMFVSCLLVFGLMLATGALHASEPPSDWKLKLQTSNTAELQLLTGLESDLTITRAAKDSALKETATVKAGIANVRGIAQKALDNVVRLTAFEEEMEHLSGIGAIWWGLKRLALHLMVAGLALAGVLTALSILFPPVGAVVGIIGKNILTLAVKRITI